MSSEGAFQAELELEAHKNGWFYYAIPDSRRVAGVGWPDVVLIKPPLAWFLELKGDKGTASLEQQAVIGALNDVERFEAGIYYPEDKDAIVETLRTL